MKKWVVVERHGFTDDERVRLRKACEQIRQAIERIKKAMEPK